jgi:PAS domain-containing protein
MAARIVHALWPMAGWHPSDDGLALLAICAGAVALACLCWALRAQARLAALRTHDAANIDYQAALDALPLPVWIRGRDLALRWGNRAFLAATGADRLEDAFSPDAAIERSEPDLASAVRDGADIADARRFAQVAGRRRALSLNLFNLPDAAIAGVAIDVSETAQVEALLRSDGDAYLEMLDRMPMALAVFDKHQHLTRHNRAYAQMWGLAVDWLASGPAKSDILDQLRETHALPEHRDFAAWKRGHLQLFEDGAVPTEEFRHLADGRSIRVVAQPRRLGGVFFLYEDVSARLRLEASFTLLAQVQRATLDTVLSGIAIFGPDGRLVLHNRAFAKLWLLREEELSSLPHLNALARLAQSRTGADSIWSIVVAGITSDEPERSPQWGKAMRADGRIISVAMSRLPDGATVVTFSDLTDVERFQSETGGSAHVAA